MMKSKIRARPVVRLGLSVCIASGVAFISSATTAGILSFFVASLRQAYMAVPRPIILAMSASCLNITVLIATTLIRCFSPSSIVLQLLLHVLVAVFWTVTIALLGNELSEHLIRVCPAADAFGQDLALVCNLYKVLFSFAVISTACAYYLAFLSALALRLLKKAGQYTAMAKTTGAPNGSMSGMSRKKRSSGMFPGLFKRRGKNPPEDERGFMMENLNTEEKQGDFLGLHSSTTSLSPQQQPMSSPEWGPRDRVRVDDWPNQFAGQETRYDPGTRGI